jgi:glycosyltransferase involved in cell wall biosynthesis
MVGGMQRNPAAIARITDRAAHCGVKLILLDAVSDRQKFEWNRSSELSVCPSSFEGYGYPPIESLYCGTPCIAFDLPNYEETCGEGLTRTAMGDIGDMINRVLNHEHISDPQKFEKARSIGDFHCFQQRVSGILSQVANVAPESQRWIEALELLYKHSRPTTWKFYAQAMFQARMPKVARLAKICWDKTH